MNLIVQQLMHLMDFIYNFTGSYGWSLVIFAVVIKAVLFYPTQQQFKSMKDMQALQPEIKKLQALYKDNPQKMQTEQMNLFKRYKVNPLGGCLPLIIQLPILWAIWKVIMDYKTKFETAEFLWIGKNFAALSFNFEIPILKIKFIGDSLATPDGIMLILYALSMYISQKITVTDPSTAQTQATMNIMMPVIFTFVLKGFQSALILYWLVFNILSIFHQIYIMKQPSNIVVSPVVIENKG